MENTLKQLSVLYNKEFHSFKIEERGYVNTGGYITDSSDNRYFIKNIALHLHEKI